MGRIIDFIKGNEYTDDEEVGGYETEEFDAVEDENTAAPCLSAQAAESALPLRSK